MESEKSTMSEILKQNQELLAKLEPLQNLANDFKTLQRDVEDLKKARALPEAAATMRTPTAAAAPTVTMTATHPGGGPGGENIALGTTTGRQTAVIPVRAHEVADAPLTHLHPREGACGAGPGPTGWRTLTQR